MRILVLGGTKFIGAHLARQLVECGHEVVLLNRGQTKPLFDLGCETIICDRSGLVAKRSEFEKRGFDVAIDVNAMRVADIDKTIAALGGCVGRICLISSQDVYRVRDVVFRLDTADVCNEAVLETGPLRGRLFPYNTAFEPGDDLYQLYDKIPAEARLRGGESYRWTICRLPAVYGPGDYQHRFYPYVRRFKDGRKHVLLDTGWAKWKWTHGYVEEVARAVALACADPKGENGIFNVGEPTPWTIRERLELVAEILDWPLEIVISEESPLPSNGFFQKLNLDQHWIVDTGKVRSLLGYEEKISFREGMERAIEWELRNAPEQFDSSFYEYDAEDAFLARRG